MNNALHRICTSLVADFVQNKDVNFAFLLTDCMPGKLYGKLREKCRRHFGPEWGKEDMELARFFCHRLLIKAAFKQKALTFNRLPKPTQTPT